MFKDYIKSYLNQYGFERMQLKAVLFDMDGVLFESMPLHAHAWSAAVKHFHLNMSPEEAYEYEGRTGKSTINILTQRTWGRDATEDEIEQIYDYKSHLFNAFPEAPKMVGAESLLRQIKNDGFQIALVTGSGQHSLLNRLNRSYNQIFQKDLMVTSFDVRHGKPSPEPYLKALKKANVQPWEAIVIENAPLGVRAGVAANVFTIAVNTGPLDDSKLLNEGAGLLFPSMQQLSEQWAQLRNCLQ